MKIASILFFIITGLWLFYIYVAGSPSTRIYRACLPVELTTKYTADITARWDPSMAYSIREAGVKSVRWCQYGLYRSFYGERIN